jgi:hypothetical protein
MKSKKNSQRQANQATNSSSDSASSHNQQANQAHNLGKVKDYMLYTTWCTFRTICAESETYVPLWGKESILGTESRN